MTDATQALLPVTQDRLIYVSWSDDGQHIRKWAREPFEGATAFANAGNGAPLGPFDADDHYPVRDLPFALRSIAENIHVECADHVLEDMVRIVTDAANVIEARISHSLPGDVGMREAAIDAANAHLGWRSDMTLHSEVHRRDRDGLAALLVEFASSRLPAVSIDKAREPAVRWEGTEDEQHAARMKVCAERRKQWPAETPDDDCDQDGSCKECTCDMADELETKGSLRRRLAYWKRRALAALTPSAPEPVQKLHELPEGHRWCRHCEQKDPHCSVCEGVGYLPSAVSGDAGEGEASRG